MEGVVWLKTRQDGAAEKLITTEVYFGSGEYRAKTQAKLYGLTFSAQHKHSFQNLEINLLGHDSCLRRLIQNNQPDSTRNHSN